FQEDSQCVRDLIYLDIALEEVLRMLVEHNSGADTGVDQLAGLIGVVMDNFGLSRHDPEILCCFNQWCRLAENPGYDRDWCLQARSVLERMSRVLGSTVDYYDSMLQPKADHLGERFHADPWTVELFTQEVVRGSGAFILSLLAGYMEPALRKSAELGDWQVISHQEAAGRIVAERLVAVQAEKIDSPTIILTDRITGDEEIPPGVTGVITPEPVDIVSHVSIRARNAGILFATCYSRDIMDELHSFKGSVLRFWIDSAGHVNFEPEEAGKAFTGPEESGIDVPVLKCRRVKFESYAVASRDLDYSVAGGKANRLAGLRGRLPDWIRTPRSVVIPFCVCEKVMENLENNALRRSYDQLVRRVDEKPEEILPLLKEVIMQLGEPEELKSAFFSAVEAEGLVWPGGTGSNWDTVWKRIRQIWASKWNERAYWSRKKWGIGHESLIMAVLVQEVVDAEYAFVIHTNNPFTGNSDEIYAEVVPGLGETLCSGNYPGRAFSFICSRNGEFSPGILSYPGKSVALRGGGIIFRSDSNGEDLSNYAGAGLYDSVLMNPPADELLDYTEISLLWDEDFRNTFMCRVAELGMEIENALDGAPQDIEGAYSGGQYYCVQTRPQVG
ncbi:MAG TPA: hypothetical protein EYP57_09325, partial [Thermodesulfobacteriaceae bacterium]|nr:hypothetical protein [Thermodesulfobacteriaceae bacterium]